MHSFIASYTTPQAPFTCQGTCYQDKPIIQQLCLMIFDGCIKYQGPLLLTWFNFNPRMDKKLNAQESVRRNHSSIPKV